MKSAESHRIVIVGGGVAGLDLASSLGRQARRGVGSNRPITVTLVDRHTTHVWKPMLHTIAAGTSDISQQQTPFIAHAIQAGFSYLPGTLSAVDRHAREIVLAPARSHDDRLLIPEQRIAYDTLVLALGSEADDFGTPGVANHCWRIDALDQAHAFNNELRLRMLQSFVMHEPLDIAIVGGGATGVELAAELVRLTELSEAYGAHGLSGRISITLIDSGDRLLAAFPEDISLQAIERLKSLAVKVMLRSRVKAATPDGFVLQDGSPVAATLKVWAAGVKAPDFLARVDGLESVAGNRLLVRPSLQCTNDPDIYAIGDCASVTLVENEKALAPTAQVASQQAEHLSRHLFPAILGKSLPPPFKHKDFGSLVSLSEYDAYGSLGRFGFFRGQTFYGRLAHFSHALLYRKHQIRIHGFWRGSAIFVVDLLSKRLRPGIRLD